MNSPASIDLSAMSPTGKPLHASPSQASLASTVVSDNDSAMNDSTRPGLTPLQRQPSSVSFGVVQVREYNRTIGDHPDVTRGAPMTLDWDYHEHERVDLVAFDEQRASQRKQFLRMPYHSRGSLLRNEFDASLEELEAAAKNARTAREQRAESQRDSDSVWSGIERKPRRKQQQGSKKTNKSRGLFGGLRKVLTSK